jgi:S1-C subfamily serine protease
MWLLALLLLHDKSGEMIVARNIFCSDCRPAHKPKPVRLLATFVSPSDTFAIVCREGSACAAVAVGSRLGEALIARIEERRVIFDDGDALGFGRLAPTPVQVDRATITSVLAHPEELVRTVTAVPAPDGIRIVALRAGSPLARVGVQRGDVIRAVNGCELAGIDASLACYQRLRNARYLSVSLVRSGAPLTLDVGLDRE